MSDVYDELVESAEVCRNCLGVVRVERIDPTRGGLARAYERSLERHPTRTSVGYGPAESVSDQKGVWCECGVESPRHRVWTDDDVDRARFRDLVQQLIRTLEHRELTGRPQRETVAAQAIQARKDGAAVDDALAAGVAAGLAVGVGEHTTQRRTEA
jgi:hypothetical protein